MRAPLIALLVLLAIGLIADIYIYVQARRRCSNRLWAKLEMWSTILFAVVMVVAMCLPARSGSDANLHGKMWTLFAWISIYTAKYPGIIIDLLASAPKLFGKPRLKWLTRCGIAISILTFCAMWWGALINRFSVDIRRIEVPVKMLPASFDGFTIAQFSDLHTGTFGTDTTFVSALVQQINGLSPDMIVFTGDIVNRRSCEMEPFVAPLSRLHAPSGVFAILGNHDYGDYLNWPSASAKRANLQQLLDLYNGSSMRLLLNETVWIRHGNDSIALIGVENIGDPPFKIYGSLNAAYPQLSDSHTKILLTHNPQHWVDSIRSCPNVNVDLTLSGHTHAMQIELAGISPAAWRYDTWGGLHTDSFGRHLYVNIGAGTVGIPMRLGATPEITLITLKSV